MYNENNIEGLEWNFGTSFYKIKLGEKGLAPYSGAPDYKNYCGPYEVKIMVEHFNNGNWKPTNTYQLIYEIY